MRHELRQVGADGSQKLPVRILPVLHAERAAGRYATPAVRVLAAYVAAVRTLTELPPDPEAAALTAAGRLPTMRDSARQVLALLDPELADDAAVANTVAGLVDEIARG